MNRRLLLPRIRDEGSAPIVGILVASAVIISALAAAISMTANEARTTKGDSQELRAMAADVLQVIVTETGRTKGGSTDWTVDPDGVNPTVVEGGDDDKLVRFGLASERGKNFLDGSKIELLRRGLREANTEQSKKTADYPEVKTALGLDGYDFHLRSFPIVYSVDDPRWSKYRGMRAALIADYDSGSVDPPSFLTPSVSDSSDSDKLVVSWTFTCTTPYAVAKDILLLKASLVTGNGNKQVTKYAYSKVVDCTNGGSPSSVTVDVRWERMAWTESGLKVKWELTSVYTDKVVFNNREHTVSNNDDGNQPYTLAVKPDYGNFYTSPSPGSDPRVLLAAYDKDGNLYDVPGNGGTIAVTVEAYTNGGCTGSPHKTYSASIPDKATQPLDLTGLTATASLADFCVLLKNGESGDSFASAQSAFTYTTNQHAPASSNPTSKANTERNVLDGLIEDFNKEPHATFSPGHGHATPDADLGDVYRDYPQSEPQNLLSKDSGNAGHLWYGADGIDGNDDDYDILVIGGGVKGSTITPIKDEIRDWVEEGGTLLVLGVDQNNAQWLESAFDVHLVTASNGISAPDETHPALTSPEQLNWRSYNAEGRRYSMTGDTYEGFTHVIVDDGEGNPDLLAISNPGVYGKGTVILSSFIPDTMTGDSKERDKFLNNMLTQSLHQMLIDFGPAIPKGVPVGSAQRLAVVPHPHDPTLYVELRLVLYVWK